MKGNAPYLPRMLLRSAMTLTLIMPDFRPTLVVTLANRHPPPSGSALSEGSRAWKALQRGRLWQATAQLVNVGLKVLNVGIFATHNFASNLIIYFFKATHNSRCLVTGLSRNRMYLLCSTGVLNRCHRSFSKRIDSNIVIASAHLKRQVFRTLPSKTLLVGLSHQGTF